MNGLSPLMRSGLAFSLVLLPSVTLIPLGGLYLWEHGLVLWWALGALLVVSILGLLLGSLLRRRPRTPSAPRINPDEGMDPLWSDVEVSAWRDVQALAERVDVQAINGTDFFIKIGQTTLDVVAQRLHAEKPDALWRFTLPEALSIVERVSRRLRIFVEQSVPLGDRLTVAQLLAVYRWRGMFDVAERAYDVWRVLRLTNPAAALTHEARERLSRAAYAYGKEHISRRISQAFILEVGRAAIDLYGGRLPVAPAQETASDVAGFGRNIAVDVVISGASRSEKLALAAHLWEGAKAATVSMPLVSDQGLPLEGRTTLKQPVVDAIDTFSTLPDTAGAKADILIWLVPAAKLQAIALQKSKARAPARSVRPAGPIVIVVSLFEAESQSELARPQLEEAARALAHATNSRFVPPVAVVSIDTDPQRAVAPLLAALKDNLHLARFVHNSRHSRGVGTSSGWQQSARQAMKAASTLSRAIVRRR